MMTRIQYLEENLAAVNVKLSKEDVEEVTRIAQASDASAGGIRYPPGMVETLFVDTPPL